MQPNRYLAVRTHSDDTWSLFYVVDTATGLALTTHGTWEDAQASAELGNAGSPRCHVCECGAALSEHHTVEAYCRKGGGRSFRPNAATLQRFPGQYPDRFQCSQCKRILPENAIVGTCPECQCQRLERA